MFAAQGGVTPNPTYVDDVFSTYLYTGNDSTQTITNGIDLAGKGGMVWVKARSLGLYHNLFDTVRGPGGGHFKALFTNTTDAQAANTGYMTSLDASGFTLGTQANTNAAGVTYASWTFRKAPKFFDVVTYSGNSSLQTISHSLGVTPGMIVIKPINTTGNWLVHHTSLGYSNRILLNSTAASVTGDAAYASSATSFSVSNTGSFTAGTPPTAVTNPNVSGVTYIAYLFAHDTAADGIIQCGSYAGTGSAGVNVTLNFEPQFVLVKRALGGTGSWYMMDSMRGMSVTDDSYLLSESIAAESVFGGAALSPTATGFRIDSSGTGLNSSGSTYIYIAIRRPNKPPTTGTQVFSPIASSAAAGTALTTNFPVDMQIGKYRSGSSIWPVVDRLRGVSTTSTEMGRSLATNVAVAEGTSSGADSNNWGNTGFSMPTNLGGISDIFYNFRRAPGVFDVVCYTGTGVNRTVTHGLGVIPELIIVKNRESAAEWRVYDSTTGNTKYQVLNSTAIPATSATTWNNTTPTASVFTVGTAITVNESSKFMVAYLFATLAGISKVFSYTGNGTSQTIDCGFTTGARFVLIKRTDSTGAWYVWDSARGIVAANDPHLSLNTDVAEVTTNDSIDPDSTGFIVNQLAATNINVNTATYIGLAFA